MLQTCLWFKVKTIVEFQAIKQEISQKWGFFFEIALHQDFKINYQTFS